MKATIHLTILLVIFVVSGFQTFAQNGKFSDLKLEITTTKQSFIQLEPIPLMFKVANLTDRNILSHGTLDFSASYVKISIKKPDGSIQNITRLSIERERIMVVEKPIPPQAHFEVMQLVSLDLNSNFPQPGRYGVQAVFISKNHQQSVKSSWLNIDILQPTGIDLAAKDFLENQTDASTIFSQMADEDIETIESFLSNFSDSNYSQYLRFVLTTQYLVKRENEKAKIHLLNLKSRKDFIYSSDVAKKLVQLKESTDL